MKKVLIHAAWLCHAQYLNAQISALPCLKDPIGLMVIENAYFSLLTNNNKLLLVTLCDTTAGNAAII